MFKTAEVMSLRSHLKPVDNNVPEPPYPADTKANGYKPEVDWQRIKSSKTWRLCPQDQRNNLLRLWLDSWNEVPTGSWENDEEVIAAAIDVPISVLHGNRSALMRGWKLHSDGRLYHPVVTEQVLEMIGRRKSTANRVRKHRQLKYVASCNALPDVTYAKEQEQELEEKKKNIQKKKVVTRFKPPTPEDVSDYCKSKGYTVDVEAFMAFYASNGWKVGKNPMKCWKSACTTWQRRNNSEQKNAASRKTRSDRGAEWGEAVWADFHKTASEDG